MKKSIVVMVFAVAMLAAYVFLVAPLDEKRSALRESLQSKYATLRKYEMFLKDAGKTGVEFDAQMKEIEVMEADVLKDKDESLAFAKLQGYIQDFANKSGVRIISIKPLSVIKFKHYAALPIQIESNGGINQLGEFMKQIDESKELIRIDRLNINVMNIQTPVELRIKIQISGLMKV